MRNMRLNLSYKHFLIREVSNMFSDYFYSGAIAIGAILGVFCMVFAKLLGIGFFLYMWGSVGTTVGAAAWAGFTLWAKVFFGGLALWVCSWLGAHY